MELWFNIYRKNKGDRTSPLVFDFSTDNKLTIASPLEEAHRAIQKICATHPGPYTIFASGGVDSQAMLYAWKTSGVDFSTVHYSYGDNIEDGKSLSEFCNRHHIDYSVRSFDVDKFINSDEYTEMAKRYDCASPHILTYMKLLSMHDETCIMAGNYMNEHGVALNWTILGLDRFRQISKPNLVPFFLCCTPELAYSFYETINDIKDSVASPNLTSYRLKVDNYNLHGFPIITQSNKLSGFESLKERYDIVKLDYRTRLKWASMPSKRPFDLIFRYGLFDNLPLGFYSDNTVIIHNKCLNR